MVKKIAVIALVAIVACPILLGYAMNLDQTTVTDYKQSDDSVNISPLLWSGTNYTYAHADVYQLNMQTNWNNGREMIPVYNFVSTNVTSYHLTAGLYQNQSWTNATQSVVFDYFYQQFDYDLNVSTHSATVYGSVGGGPISNLGTIPDIHSFYYEKDAKRFTYERYLTPTTLGFGAGNAELSHIVLNSSGGSCNVYQAYYNVGNTYADLSAGYYYTGNYDNYNSFPDHTRNILVTINLDSITAANYRTTMTFGGYHDYYLDKTTSGGDVTWTVTDVSDPTDTFTLFYDSSRNDNTYQVYADIVQTGQHTSGGDVYADYASHREFRYIGGWPTLIGEANTYMTYSDDVTFSENVNNGMVYMSKLGFRDLSSYTGRSPTIRIDDAVFGAFTYQVMQDRSFSPSAYRSNPATTITDINQYGTSITFGGDTYTVSNGKITLGSKQVPVKDLVFNSVPTDGAQYENRIGNTVISTTAAPSDISFNGSWSASISITSMEPYTHTRTEWKAGEFGWDGIDQNFLMTGLLTCLGTFIALGIYARKTGSGGIIPLMIVTGGAAMVFFVLL